MNDLLDALGVTGTGRRFLTSVAIWIGFPVAMVGIAAGQAVVEYALGATVPLIVAEVVVVWAFWTLWHSVCFRRRQLRYRATGGRGYRKAFVLDIFPAISVGFSQMLRPSWNGENLALGRVLPVVPTSATELARGAVGLVIGLVALLLFVQAWRTLGAARVGFVCEFVAPESFVAVRRGPYNRIRHALFWSGIGVSWSLALLTGTAAGLLLATVNTVYGMLYNILEDRRLQMVFGERYAGYARDVPRIIPRRLS